jgi:hypothetical protein
MKLFVDEFGMIESQRLQSECKSRLKTINEKIRYILEGPKAEFWEKLHARIIKIDNVDEKQAYLKIEAQLRTLPTFIDTWGQTSVETPERWECFVMMKAQEIKSGDKNHDYFWALAIRHDQMVALIRILDTLETELEGWLKMDILSVMENEKFWGLAEYPIEKQIYLEAEQVHKEREKGHT